VALNRGAEILEGFRGEVHPILHRHNELQVTANWNYNREARRFFGQPPTSVCDLFLKLKTAIPTKIYSERDFSRFLPAGEFGPAGQMWALDQDKVADFLKQFHPAPSMRLVAKGRRAGPDGAFAVLRAISASHLDIVFRIHAEFDVMPSAMKCRQPVPEAWYSPAAFLGRLVLNRDAGTVEYFWLGLPTDMPNVHVTFATGHDDGEGHDWMRVERMELQGGNLRSVEGMCWTDQIETAKAHDRLAKIFFKFMEISWVAFDEVQAAARAQKKPIFAVVPLGALGDQTC
jgi:hypothetical protein